MTLHHRVIGIDVSKDHLDLHDTAGGKTWRMANRPEEIGQWLVGLEDGEAFVVFEATGGYDTELWLALQDKGRGFARVNPAQARAFARARGYLAKTDRIDARMLAEMGLRLQPAPTPVTCPQRLELQALGRRRTQLVDMRKQEKTRLKQTREPELASDIEDHLAWLTRSIKAIETRIDRLIRTTVELADNYRLIISVPGIGPVTAATLLALMPEIGQTTRRAVAALAGLAPINNDSGRKRGKMTIRGGRREVRRNLYMAAVAAIRGNNQFAAFYRSLKDRGMPNKVALIAMARKMIVTVNAIVKTRTPFAKPA